MTTAIPTDLAPSVKRQTDLVFREEDHSYWWKGERVPGISEILKKLGLVKDYEGVDPFYRERGIAAHRAIALHLDKNLDEASLDPVVRPFFDAWVNFEAKEGYLPMAWETPLYHEFEGYACTFDHYGLLNQERVCLDVKCTKKHDPGSDYQVCGQVLSLRYNGHICDRQGILELHDDGTYTLCWYPVDLTVWSAIMTLYRRKIKKK